MPGHLFDYHLGPLEVLLASSGKSPEKLSDILGCKDNPTIKGCLTPNVSSDKIDKPSSYPCLPLQQHFLFVLRE